jgi:hypothetical protein
MIYPQLRRKVKATLMLERHESRLELRSHHHAVLWHTVHSWHTLYQYTDQDDTRSAGLGSSLGLHIVAAAPSGCQCKLEGIVHTNVGTTSWVAPGDSTSSTLKGSCMKTNSMQVAQTKSLSSCLGSAKPGHANLCLKAESSHAILRASCTLGKYC